LEEVEAFNVPLFCRWRMDVPPRCLPDSDLFPCTIPMVGGDWWYPHARLVEARQTLPPDAPPLPPGITVGWETDLDLAPGTNTRKFPSLPTLVGWVWDDWENVEVWTPWSAWLGMAGCACSVPPGRFGDEYRKSVTCSFPST
jgi:hypothetical protein